MSKKNEAIRNTKNFDELLDIQYGKIGARKRDEFEAKAQYFVISETLKDARRGANMTQEELAHKVGTKKSYISRLENGKRNSASIRGDCTSSSAVNSPTEVVDVA